MKLLRYAGQNYVTTCQYLEDTSVKVQTRPKRRPRWIVKEGNRLITGVNCRVFFLRKSRFVEFRRVCKVALRLAGIITPKIWGRVPEIRHTRRPGSGRQRVKFRNRWDNRFRPGSRDTLQPSEFLCFSLNWRETNIDPSNTGNSWSEIFVKRVKEIPRDSEIRRFTAKLIELFFRPSSPLPYWHVTLKPEIISSDLECISRFFSSFFFLKKAIHFENILRIIKSSKRRDIYICKSKTLLFLLHTYFYFIHLLFIKLKIVHT